MNGLALSICIGILAALGIFLIARAIVFFIVIGVSLIYDWIAIRRIMKGSKKGARRNGRQG